VNAGSIGPSLVAVLPQNGEPRPPATGDVHVSIARRTTLNSGESCRRPGIPALLAAVSLGSGDEGALRTRHHSRC